MLIKRGTSQAFGGVEINLHHGSAIVDALSVATRLRRLNKIDLKGPPVSTRGGGTSLTPDQTKTGGHLRDL